MLHVGINGIFLIFDVPRDLLEISSAILDNDNWSQKGNLEPEKH